MKIISGRRNASYTFDADNRLTSLTIIQPDASTSTSYYHYDSSGQRIYSKDVTMSSAGAILETRETYTISKNYSETYVNGVLKTKNTHIFAGDLMLASVEYGGGSDAPLIKGELKGDLVIYHLSDHLGSTSVSTDTTGAIVELSDYFAYGSPRQSVQTNTSPEKRKYIGQEYDISTGLNYLNARYYNSAIGRFISQDPVFWEMSDSWFLDPQSQNSYSYARNNPVNLLDTNGESWMSFAQGMLSAVPGIIVGVAIGAAVVAISPAAAVAVGVIGVGIGVVATASAINNAIHASNADDRDYYIGQALVTGVATAFGAKGLSKVSGAAKVNAVKAATQAKVESTLPSESFVGTRTQTLKDIKWSTVAKPDRSLIQNEKFGRLIDEYIYKEGSVFGNKSTADAIRFEKATGEKVFNRFHDIKGRGIVNAMNNLIKSGKLSESDTDIAIKIRNDTQSALDGN